MTFNPNQVVFSLLSTHSACIYGLCLFVLAATVFLWQHLSTNLQAFQNRNFRVDGIVYIFLFMRTRVKTDLEVAGLFTFRPGGYAIAVGLTRRQ
ncbi:hypothetical protein BJJ98_19520 [Dickeya solani]|nr:hypothetical protein A4U42_01490 [Dickeya solani IPO 2222]AUH10460.1 hypothetical protein BJD21_19550 [Dickeya solani D s0432-1]AUH14396.1 hypothetical protein BJJ98_19520 [Dickeya solani]